MRVAPAEVGALLAPGTTGSACAPVDAILVDAHTNLAATRNFCRCLDTTEHEALIGTVRNVGYRFVPGPLPATRSTEAGQG